MQRIRRTGAVLALAGVTAFAGQAIGAGGAGKYPTRTSIKIDREVGQDIIFGKLRSDHHGCAANRKVKLYHREVKWQEKASVIARPRTNGKGKWRFEARRNSNGENYATPGYYHVHAGEKRLGGGIVCKEKFSSPIFTGS
jgi:hypothetical protein